jgi:hypothetical protein
MGSAASLFLGNRLARDRAFAGWVDDFRLYTGAGDLSFVESVRQSAAGPAGLAGTPGNNKVVLSWNSLLGATSYNVKRSGTSGGPYSIISQQGMVTGTTYTDFMAVNGTTYYYVVSAGTSLSAASQTANSPQELNVTLGTPPPPPAAGYNGPVYTGMTLELTASAISGAIYNWTGPDGFSSTNQNPSIPNAAQSNSGIYSVSATVGGYTSETATTTVTINPPALVSIQSSSGKYILNWPFGTMQSTTNILGPWTNLTGVASPYTNFVLKPDEFYRVRLQ